MQIEIKDWDHQCMDGCCYRTGTDIIIGDKKVSVEDLYSGQVEAVIEALLPLLNIKYEIV